MPALSFASILRFSKFNFFRDEIPLACVSLSSITGRYQDTARNISGRYAESLHPHLDVTGM
jgi:hypothetical protein